MNVVDLGDLDGMLFVFDSEVQVSFTMRDTRIPLDIVFFDAEGLMVTQSTMVPCDTDPCPLYQAGRPFAFALETPAGSVTFQEGDGLEPT